MPYISENDRKILDNSISTMVLSLKRTLNKDESIFSKESLSNEEVLKLLGNINYCFSRVVGNIIGDHSYGKIAMITGVLENIKQEFYRRLATPYENTKVIENGDIPEYKS